MRIELRTKTFTSYGYRFKDGPPNNCAQIWSVGWEERTSSSYNWNGLKRKEYGKCVFQYTLSGFGILEQDGERLRLNPGQAFFVQIPSNHSYYLPEASDRWEFIYVMLYGTEVLDCFDFISNHFGPVLHFHPESTVIQTLLKLYRKASEMRIADTYQAAGLAYQFVMELYRSVQGLENPADRWHESISKACAFAKNYFYEPIGVEDLAKASGLSKYHFARLFSKTTGLTPIQYLTKIRIEQSVQKLNSSRETIEEIAKGVGFSSGNYFCKVFRQLVGISPGEYRTGQNTSPVDHLAID